jgi:acetolactate synthase-1/2/3 large subunit
MESKVKYPIVLDEYKKEKLVNPYVFMDVLSKKIDDDAIIIPEIGTNVIVSCQVLQLKENQRLFSSWANSPMGYSIPASIGAQLGNTGRQIISILGDGGLQVNLQDLQTIRHYNLPIKIFIWNNHVYATIQDFQDGNLDGRYEATDLEHGYSHPDFSKIAAAYDIPHILISSNDELTKIEQVLKAKGPVLCELSMDSKFRVSPRQGANDQFHELSPKRSFSLF